MREFRVGTTGVLDIVQQVEGGRGWWWHLTAFNKPIFVIGNSCGTCEALFQRVSHTVGPLHARGLAERLNSGLAEIDDPVISAVSQLLPAGAYWAGLIELHPRLVINPWRPNWVGCSSSYFWWRQFSRSADSSFYELVLPMVSALQVNVVRVAYYVLRMLQGRKQTALAFSILDERMYRARMRETGLGHFLIDGHHKVLAASMLGRSIPLLSFLLVSSEVKWLDWGRGVDSIRDYYQTGVAPRQL